MSIVSSPVRPYRGLAAFGDAPLDALFFFGREREREIIVANLLASRLTVLYGPTGVGKTSLLQAGVVPQLRALPDTTVASFASWSVDPTPDIDAVVSGVDGHVYLIVDQLEEYFIYHGEDGRFAVRLPELVTERGGRVNVLVGIREDSLAKLDTFKSRIPGLFANYLRLDHLDRDEARAAIVGPLDRLGELNPDSEPYAADPELVEAVLDQVATGRIDYGVAGRGSVGVNHRSSRIEAPFLQLVMERLWDVEREAGSHLLRRSTLDDLGGAETIVRGHLERALESLDPRERELAADVFEHLVTPSGMKIAHDVGDLARYASASEHEVGNVLSRLASERIVKSVNGRNGGGRYEIFHDVLAGGVLAWGAAFEAEREVEIERRRRRRALATAGVALLALAVVTAVALFALYQRQEARDLAQRARARELVARAGAMLTVDPLQSVALASRAARLEPTPAVERQLRDALIGARERAVFSALGPVVDVAIAPDGRRIASGAANGWIRVVDPVSKREISRFRHPGLVDLTFTRDGAALVSAGTDGDARVWDPETGAPSVVVRGRAPLTGVTVSRDGRELATGGRDGVVLVARVADGRPVSRTTLPDAVTMVRFAPSGEWVAAAARTKVHIVRPETGETLRVLTQRGAVTSLDFSASGRMLATGGADRVARIWKLPSGVLMHQLSAHDGQVVDVAFNQRGTLLVTASTDGTARVWDVTRGTPKATMLGHRNFVNSAQFGASGLYVVTASRDGSARVWYAEGGRLLASLLGHEENVERAVFLPGGNRVVTWSTDGTFRLWDSGVRKELQPIDGYGADVTGVSADPAGGSVLSGSLDGEARLWRSGRTVRRFRHGAPVTDVLLRRDRGFAVTAGTDGAVKLWRLGGNAPLRTFRHPVGVVAVAITRDGSQLATAAEDRRVRIWSLRTGALLRELRHNTDVLDVAFDPSGERVATAGADRIARIWRGTTVVREFRGHRDAVTSVAFGPGGDLLVTASADHDARLWSAATGRTLRVLAQHFAVVSEAAFSPDARWIVTAGPSNVGLWPVRGGGLPYMLRGHAGIVHSATFGGGSRYVYSGGTDGTVRRYRCIICAPTPELLRVGELRLRQGRVR